MQHTNEKQNKQIKHAKKLTKFYEQNKEAKNAHVGGRFLFWLVNAGLGYCLPPTASVFDLLSLGYKVYFMKTISTENNWE